MPQPHSELTPVPFEAVAAYFRQALPSCTIEQIGAGGIPLLVLRAAHSAIGVAASTQELEKSYEASYARYKDYFLKSETSPLVDPAYVLLLPSGVSADIERFCSTVETNVYFCRKFVVPLNGSLEHSLARLPFLPLAAIGGSSLRPASAQTFLQRHGASTALARSLVTPHDRGPEKTVEDAIGGVFGNLTIGSEKGLTELAVAERPNNEVVVDSITIKGIRAYNRPQSFELGEALTVLYGPNGFGKTSFFDAIDFAITGGVGRLSALSDAQLDRVLPHLDTKPRDGTVTLTFRRNGQPLSLSRTVRDRKWATLNGEKVDRKTVLSSLTKGANQSADRVENFISLFRATHLFSQEQQEIAKDFRRDCQLNESVVSRLLAFEDYNNAVNKLLRITQRIDQQMGDLSGGVEARNTGISKARAEIERIDKSIRTASSGQVLDEEFATLRAALVASQANLSLSSLDVEGLRALRSALDAQIAEANAHTGQLNRLVPDIASLPKMSGELSTLGGQLTELRKQAAGATAERNATETALAEVDKQVGSLKATIAGITAQSTQLTWVLENIPRRDNAVAEIERLQALRSTTNAELVSMQARGAALRTTIAKADDDLGTVNAQIEELAERESALRSLIDVVAQWSDIEDWLTAADASVETLGLSKQKVAGDVESARARLVGLDSEIRDISDTIRRSDEQRAELQQLLASLESHADGQDCPLCGQEYRSHDELIARIKAKSAQDPLHLLRDGLADKRSAQIEAQSRYDAARRVQRTTETQLTEAERGREVIRQRRQEVLALAAESGFSLEAADFTPEAVAGAAEDAKRVLSGASELARTQKQAGDQARAELSSVDAAIKRRQDEVVRIDALIERQRADLQRLQGDTRYSEALAAATPEEREERRTSLNQALAFEAEKLSAAEAEQARLKKSVSELARRLTNLGAQSQQISRKEMDLQSARASAVQRITSAGLAADTSNEELLAAVTATTKRQSDLEILKEKAASLEVGLDAAASTAIVEQHRATIKSEDAQVKKLREQQRRLREVGRYFTELHRLVSTEQNQAITNFTLEYGPRTSVIQRRLRSVYSFDDVEIRAKNAKITVSVKRNGEELRPIDFFSQSQQQTLMLGLFLTACSAQTWSSFSTVFLDDPVTHFDDLNTYALLDLISGLLENNDGGKQFILSTCDDRFLELARQKFRALGPRARFYHFTAIGSDGPVVAELN